MKRIALLGAGGHAKVVWDTLLCMSEPIQVVAVLDDNPELWGKPFGELFVDGPVQKLESLAVDAAIVTIGKNVARRTVYGRAKSMGVPLFRAIHPSAVIARGVQLGEGVVIFAHVTVNTGTIIDDDVILNTACSVDHGCELGAHVHIAPGANLCGGVYVGETTLVGVGVVVIPGVHIGANATIGGGAAVIDNLPDGVTAVGVPARILVQGQKL